MSPQSNFMQELIKPCNCSTKYHRVCIREKIVRGLLKQCSECQTDYSVGFTDCYAIFNKVKPNYLGYMFVQELLFFLSIIAFSEVVRTTAMYNWRVENPSMQLQWYIILQTLPTACTALALIVFFVRFKGIYCVREIQDIVIYDVS